MKKMILAGALAFLVLAFQKPLWGVMYIDSGPAPEKYHDYSKELKKTREAAQKNDPEAEYKLGVMYREGHGLKEDPDEGRKWIQKSADQGFPQAQNDIGWMYENGLGVPADKATALKWYRKAAEKGTAMAENNLGWLYWNGSGVPKDLTQAVGWFQKAAEQGLSEAQCSLGCAYEKGQGIKRDNVEAYKWFLLAKGGCDESYDGIERLKAIMTADQIAEAKKQADSWQRDHLKSPQKQDQ